LSRVQFISQVLTVSFFPLLVQPSGGLVIFNKGAGFWRGGLWLRDILCR
jgi:hypothetical protein